MKLNEPESAQTDLSLWWAHMQTCTFCIYHSQLKKNSVCIYKGMYTYSAEYGID